MSAPDYEEIPDGVDEYIWRFLCAVYPDGPNLALAAFNERHAIKTATALLRRAARIEAAATDAEETLRLIHNADGKMRRSDSMPAKSTFEAWNALREALEADTE